MGRPATRRSVFDYVLCYLLLAVLAVIGYFVVVEILPTAFRRIIAALADVSDVDVRYAATAVYQVFVLILLLSAFVGLLASEVYLRKGVEKGLLLSRFLRLLVVLVAIGGLGLLIQAVAA